MRLLPCFALLSLSILASFPLLASDEDDSTRIQLEARASRQVDNDQMRATLFVQVENGTPSGASSRAARTMNKTLEKLRKESGLSVRTGNMRTFPVSKNGNITGWRARNELVIESGNFPATSAAIGAVSSDMQLARIEFFLSPALRESVEAELSGEAIAAFLKKARRIAQNFGADEFDVAEASVADRGGAPVRPMMRSMAADSPGVAPEFSGGTSVMQVSVSGTILIRR